ncbi:MAG: hypothetical protein Q9197_004130 [Variospora fuerteventurae]
MVEASVFQPGGELVGQCEGGLASLADLVGGELASMSWSVADASLALFHHTSFDYPVKTESETLEHIGSYAGHLPFAADSHVRPDGYGLLDHQLLQSIPVPMPVSTPKYSRFPGGFEIPPFNLILLPLPSLNDLLGEWLDFPLAVFPGNVDRLLAISELSAAVLPVRVRQ